MVKIIPMNKTRLSKEYRTNIASKSTAEQLDAAMLRYKSMSDKEYSTSANVKRSFGTVRDNLQCNPATIVKTKALNSSNNRSFGICEEKMRRDRKKREESLWPKLCCCALVCMALLIIGAIATVVAILALQSSKTTASVTALTTIDTTTVTTTATTTVTTISLSSTTTIASTTTSMILTSASQVNWLINGDGETGACESSSNVTHPTGWNYNGTITQIYYNDTNGGDLMWNDPGPSDRGQCYFYGQQSAVTTMWQTANMTGSVNLLLIDNQTVWFNFSAWIGGYQSQNDNAQVSLTFTNQTNQNVGNTIILGPILAANRASVSSLLFRQTNGLVPMGARSFTVVVTITRTQGTTNDGDIDNIAVLLYQ